MAGLFDRLGNIFKSGKSSGDTKRKKTSHNIRFNEDPSNFWTIVGELGDGAFGKVYKVSGGVADTWRVARVGRVTRGE